MTPFAELAAATNFSFLRGASHAQEMVAQAAQLGLAAIGIADRNSLAGVVRAHKAAKEHKIKLLVGVRLVTRDGFEVICYPTDRAAYGRLTRLLTFGNRRATKGECHLDLPDILAVVEGQVFIAMPPRTLDATFTRHLAALSEAAPSHVFLAATLAFDGRDRTRLGQLADLARQCATPLVATTDALYHHPERKPLADVLACIREKCTIHDAGYRLTANAERHLKPGLEMARLYARMPEAVARTAAIADRITFNLDQLRYEYPDEPVPPGKTPQGYLEEITHAHARERYPEGIPPKVTALIAKELALIAELGYAQYFLTVYDLVRYARGQNILCQGRGAAANSAVCYCLGITSVDPTEIDLLFERFISADRGEPPDIDVDFEHERREEVIQYLYARYGRHRAAICATVIHYRPRMAIREVGKALGLTEDVTSALSGLVWGYGDGAFPEAHIREAGLDPNNPELRQALGLANTLLGFPRHLSQHVGGFVLTRHRLDETVPILNAAMEDRTNIEWDKDDIDALGILKVDVLALGMLTAIAKSFDMIEQHYGWRPPLAMEPTDPRVYAMLSEADSVGVFQVESRAQMSMLPRLKPRKFYDLVIEVAIVRPGPIQGDMVHPYLRRRDGIEDVTYPSKELETVLGKTLGVPLFQEQAMQIAIVGAGFTPGEADKLRRAMATFRHVGTIHTFRQRFIEGMVARNYQREFAERCFSQIEGFGEYGFPESHAASFALLVYVSAWIKCYYPEVFCAALLNSQPMGFYQPAQLVRDAREHGVVVRPPDINASNWDCTLEPAAEKSATFADPTGVTSAGDLSSRSEKEEPAGAGGESGMPLSIGDLHGALDARPKAEHDTWEDVRAPTPAIGHPRARPEDPAGSAPPTQQRSANPASGGGGDRRTSALGFPPPLTPPHRGEGDRSAQSTRCDLHPSPQAPSSPSPRPCGERGGHATPSSSTLPPPSSPPPAGNNAPSLSACVPGSRVEARLSGAFPHRCETTTQPRCAVRLGLRLISGLSEDAVKDTVLAARGEGYRDIPSLWLRSAAPAAMLERLADADTFRSLGLDRRRALWAVKGLEGGTLQTGHKRQGRARAPIFARPETGDLFAERHVALPATSLGEHVVEDYSAFGLSLKAHPISFFREGLRERGIITSAEHKEQRRAGRRATVAGLVLVRQRPGTAKGVIFLTLEDETGIVNVVVWAKMFEQHRRVVMNAKFLAVRGKIERSGIVIHVIAEDLIDLTPELALLSSGEATMPDASKDVREGSWSPPWSSPWSPKSRDFH